MRTLVLALGLTSLLFAVGAKPALAQHADIVDLKNGNTISGVVNLVDGKVVVVKKRGEGELRYVLSYDRLAPHSLYSILRTRLAPLDHREQRQVADAAFAAKLFYSAAKHYRASAPDPARISDDLFKRIDESERQDFSKMMGRSKAALDREDFRRARRIALGALRRYKHRPAEETKRVTEQLERITKHMETARLRVEALKKSRVAKAVLEKHERSLRSLENLIAKAQNYESKGLSTSRKFRRAKGYYDLALRRLGEAGVRASRSRRNRELPADLRQRLLKAEDEIITMQIRLRLHLASLYTVRGSYSSAIAFVNKALAIDPTDQGALAARRGIEQAAAAASSSGGFIR